MRFGRTALPFALALAVSTVAANTVASVKPSASAFPLSAVRLLDGPFKHAETLNRTYLLSLDPARLLYHFRTNAGILANAQPYEGWEGTDWDFPGHTLGHYLSACALMAAHGDEPEFQLRVDTIVAALAECQRALVRTASHPGFLDPQPESVFEKLERGEGGGVPYYTMHKTLAGILDAHELAHNAQALTVLEGVAAWLKFRLDRLSDAQLQHALRIEHGGMNEALANLYGITHHPEHLHLAERFNHALFFEPFARGEDPLGPGPGPAASRLLHGNTQVPKALGAAREYELTGNENYRAVATNFWRNVVTTRSFIFGGNTDAERFFARDTESQHLTPRTGESCNTYNLLKLTRHLFAWAPSAELMDFHERALFNHILATQHPETGRCTYFMSLELGGRKRFGTAEHTFWCCTGSSMESYAKFADSIYFHDEDSLYINLFIASELRWAEKGIVVLQETRFPTDDRTDFLIRTAQPQRLAVRIRYPYWSGMPTVMVNNEPQSLSADAKPSSYLTLEREWRDGDRVSVRWPMSLRVVPLRDDPGLVAFMFGPLVLAGDLGREGREFQPSEFADNGKDSRGPRVPEDAVLAPALVGDTADLVTHVCPVAGSPLSFRTDGIGRPRDVTLLPLHRIVDESYTVYWRRYDVEGWEHRFAPALAKEKARAATAARIVDAVWAGEAASEQRHAVDAATAPLVSSRLSLYREATAGRVSWKLKATGSEPLRLRIGYLGGTAAAFDVIIDGRVLAHERPATPAAPTLNRATTTTIKTYDVSAEFTAGKSPIEVGFVGHPADGPARIVFCELSRIAP